MEIYSLIGYLVCVVMLVSGYKSIRKPEKREYRISAWLSAAVLGIMLLSDNFLGITVVKMEQEKNQIDARTLAAAMKDTKRFLLSVEGIKRVDFFSDDEGLVIKIEVSSTMSGENIRELENEVTREFLHNVIDEIDNPQKKLMRGAYSVNVSIRSENSN